MARYDTLFTIKRLWLIFGLSLALSFSLLLFFGGKIYQMAPPMPARVASSAGQELFTLADIQRGQNIWQSLGGMQRGSIWGHGSYLAPDWSADWLHREAEALLDILARQRFGLGFDALAEAEQQGLLALVRLEMKRNTYDPVSGLLTLSPERALAVAQVSDFYGNIFQARDTPVSQALREDYAFSRSLALADADLHAFNGFIFWTAWSATTLRPGDTISYTSNWPYEPLVDNRPSGSLFVWTFLSIFLLLASIGALVWFYAHQYDVWREDMEPEGGIADHNLLSQVTITPSMRATEKYFWTVVALIAAQVLLGIITAHYAVEGQDFYGIPLSEYLPYAVTRTWHTQLAVFWIATAWLATGLYVAPLISGHEPRLQRLGVNVLYGCLLLIVVGSSAGEWLGIRQFFQNLSANFWFGHQGYEYVDLGRFWQLFLFVGLLLWLLLMLRALYPVLRATEHSEGRSKSLVFMLVVSASAIGLLYGAGLVWGEHTPISIMEYWRWWVVHLWVEGIFEVFSTTVIALLFVKMGLLRSSTAAISVLFATIIFLAGGVLGTFHHLYFSGTPIGVIALGGVFSALEVVPLVVIGFEAYNHVKLERKASWVSYYYWPLMFFSAVLFWNFLGAGLFGFLINPPLALYYMQGLNTTATHAHAALFGVYGMLGIGLMLFCLRGLSAGRHWHTQWLKISFWCFNIGLAMMVFMSLLPQGLWQAYNSYSHGYWYARSTEFIHSPLMEALVWARVPGDIVFAAGVLALCGFVIALYTGGKDKALP
ncbi:MAG: nitric-oxide reductase large subunit [Pseudomonadales bacterium]|nr:nitric-oxide reductase large subunit [Pseudomonadales bacterium]